MQKLFTYIVRVDSGTAPNPFWNGCTLALCTPNHQGSSVTKGDWITCFSTKATGHQFIYAMEVDERIHMNDYFEDPRFQRKKPNLKGNWRQRCGDNFYSARPDGEWLQHPNLFHEGLEAIDTRVPYVFVGKNFWYLGENRVSTPKDFCSMVGGRGARVNHPAGVAEKFKVWVKNTFNAGVSGMPLDSEAHTARCL